jgi:phosphatidylserine/phosphatidylglycerophosphate/cardiolipin synthase-like enzyme
MRHKVIIIDKKIVVTGSMNPTSSGNLRNDENVLIIYDENIAKKYLNEFERMKNLKS